MKFQTKILLVTLSILILTLLMNSVLSLASFEKVYVKSQISTYELICKDLKRKIERSLKFGKPLEKFKNMDKLLQDTLEQNPDIATLAVCDLNGTVLYHTEKKEIGRDYSKTIPVLDKDVTVRTLLKDHYYHSFISVLDKNKKPAGIIRLTFSRQIIINKLKSMANKNFSLLWILMLLTSILLVFLLAMVIMRPINSQVLEMKEILNWDNGPKDDDGQDDGSHSKTYRHYLKEGMPDTMDEEIIANYLQLSTVRNEIDRLGVNIETFSNSAANSMKRLESLHNSQDEFLLAVSGFQAELDRLKKKIGQDSDLAANSRERRMMEQMTDSLTGLETLLDTLIQTTNLRLDLEAEPVLNPPQSREKDAS